MMFYYYNNFSTGTIPEYGYPRKEYSHLLLLKKGNKHRNLGMW